MLFRSTITAEQESATFQRGSEGADVGGASEATGFRCDVCGLPIAIGDYPCISTPRPHAQALKSKAELFSVYFDYGLGAEVTAPDHRRRLMKAGKLDYRDKMRPGEISARKDRIADQKRAAQRVARGSVSDDGLIAARTIEVEWGRPSRLFTADGRPLVRKAGF